MTGRGQNTFSRLHVLLVPLLAGLFAGVCSYTAMEAYAPLGGSSPLDLYTARHGAGGRSLMGQLPTQIESDLVDDSAEFVFLQLYLSSDTTCSVSKQQWGYRFGVCYKENHGGGYNTFTKTGDDQVTQSVYSASDCSGTATSTLTISLTGQPCTGLNSYHAKLLGINKIKPWSQTLTVARGAGKWEAATCTGPMRGYEYMDIKCGDDIFLNVPTAVGGTRTKTALEISYYTDLTCTTLQSLGVAVLPYWECNEDQGANEALFPFGGDVKTGRALATTATVAASVAVASSIATGAVGSSTASSTAGGTVGGTTSSASTTTSASSAAGPIIELILALQTINVITSMGFVSAGSTFDAFSRSMTWSNLYFDPPFSMSTHSEANRRLLVVLNRANPDSEGSSEQFVGNLFWVVIIFLILIVVHAVVLGAVTLGQVVLAAIRKKPRGGVPGWVRVPKWEAIYWLVVSPGLALTSTQAVRNFDHQVSYVAILVLFFLPIVPVLFFFVTHRGTRKNGGHVKYKGIAEYRAALHPKRFLTEVKMAGLRFMYKCDVWSTFFETTPVFGEWENAHEDATTKEHLTATHWFDTWDFLFADYTHSFRFYGSIDLLSRYSRAVIVGLIAGFNGAAYFSWSVIMVLIWGDLLLRYFFRVKNKKVSQLLATASNTFFSLSFFTALFQTTQDGLYIANVNNVSVEYAMVTFVFTAVFLRILEVFCTTAEFIFRLLSPVFATIRASRSNNAKATGDGKADGAVRGTGPEDEESATPAEAMEVKVIKMETRAMSKGGKLTYSPRSKHASPKGGGKYSPALKNGKFADLAGVVENAVDI